MTRGRKRKFNQTIPGHIDQAKIPDGIYWDASGNGRWYVLETADGKPCRHTVAWRDAKLSDLFAIAEDRRGVDRGSLSWLLEQFHASEQYKELAAATRHDYDKCRRIAIDLPTKLGRLGELKVDRLSPPVIQRIVDKIAGDGTPSKANHLLRYLRRVFHWGINRGHCAHNPAKGVEQATERKHVNVPTLDTMRRVIAFARERGALKAHTEGSCAPYLWIFAEIAYRCRLRGIEVITLTDANASEVGILSNRRKGSRDNTTEWSPSLRDAWDAAVELRKAAMARYSRPIPIQPDQRILIVSQDGTPLRKDSLNNAWTRLMRQAIAAGVITPDQRFGLHGFKHRGITDTPGTRGEKQLAGGHKSEAMVDVYDHSVPVVKPAGE